MLIPQLFSNTQEKRALRYLSECIQSRECEEGTNFDLYVLFLGFRENEFVLWILFQLVKVCLMPLPEDQGL